MTLPSVIDVTVPIDPLVLPAGAVPGTDCWAAFQKACDASLLDGKPHCIYVPGHALPYRVSRPILADASMLSFRGDGEGLSVIQAIGHHDVLQFGVRRDSNVRDPITDTWKKRKVDSTYWVDSNATVQGVPDYLDAYAGQRYGLRTNGDAYVYFQGTPFDMASGPRSANRGM